MELQWPLIIFTTLVCLSAGILAFTSVFNLLGKGEKVQQPALIVAFASIVVGGIASALHLQTPMNYFGQFGNPTSGINQELVCVALAALVMIIYFVQLRRGNAVAKWIPVAAIVIAVVLVVVMSHSYMMAAIPAWNTVLLPVFYLAAAASLGATGVALISVAVGCDEADRRQAALWAVVATVVAVVATLAYCGFIASLSGESFYEVFHTDVTTVPPLDPVIIGDRMISGDLALLFWGGIVACLVVALVLDVAAWRLTASALPLLTGAMVLLIISGLAFRALLYVAGATLMTY